MAEDAEANVHFKGLEFWRRLAAAADAEGNVESEAELEAFIAQFDGALFTPALPARREAYGIADAWVLEGPEGGSSDGQERDEQSSHGQSSESIAPDASDAATDAAAEPRRRPHVTAREPRHPPRPVPSLTPLPITMGDSLRRLRIMAQLERTESGRRARRPVSLNHRRPTGITTAASSRGARLTTTSTATQSSNQIPTQNSSCLRQSTTRESDMTAVQSLATSLTGLAGDAALRMLGAMLGTNRLLGTAIGTAANLAAEAERRRRSRVVAINRCNRQPA